MGSDGGSSGAQIRQMVNFILQEAHEKANEIRIKVRVCVVLEKRRVGGWVDGVRACVGVPRTAQQCLVDADAQSATLAWVGWMDGWIEYVR